MASEPITAGQEPRELALVSGGKPSISHCDRLNCVLSKDIEGLISCTWRSIHVTFFGNRIFADDHIKRGH